jgi:hypothetical protein
MATINTTDPKPGFVYDLDTDTWFPLLGLATQSLDELTDVVITSPATSQVLAYNGTNWVNSSEAGDVSAVTSGTGITVTNGTGPIPSIAIDTTVTVDLSTAQTLTNKTLTSPTITTPVLNQAVLVSPEERFNIVASAATGTVALDALTSGSWYYTSNATGNWVLNVRGSSSTSLNSILTTGDSITVAFLATQGSTAYYNTSLQVDGTTSNVTVEWQGGTVPAAGNASGIDVYLYNIIKTASATYTVLASQTKFA